METLDLAVMADSSFRILAELRRGNDSLHLQVIYASALCVEHGISLDELLDLVEWFDDDDVE